MTTQKSDLPAGRWLAATPITGSDEQPLTSSQIDSWRNQGYALVNGLVADALIAAVRSFAAGQLPAPGSSAAESTSDFGGDLVFPSRFAPLNAVTLHPSLLAAVAQLLGCAVTSLRLSQSDLWAKYGRAASTAGALDNADQRIHIDYPNHTLAHPTEWSRPEAVEMIVYYSDVDDCGGPTAVVPRTGPQDPAYRWPIVDSPGIAELDYVNDRKAAEQAFARRRPALAQWRDSLYEREARVFFKPGDVLFYRHDVWHRGTPMRRGAMRIAQNITYRRAECEWISTLHKGWAWSAYRQDKFLERLIAQSSLDQRAVLGFPQPGSRYWSAATIDAVEARHGVFGMDMAPYRQALQQQLP